MYRDFFSGLRSWEGFLAISFFFFVGLTLAVQLLEFFELFGSLGVWLLA